MLEIHMMRWRKIALRLKRGIDVVGAGAGLMALSPVLALTAVAVAVTQGRPVFFRHVRPGLGGKPFTIIKFRTMRPLRPGERPYETDQKRVTKLGEFLRSTSIDELPELWNVIRGDMSLVGPRPLLMEYLERYTPEERRRHDMPPGITGWAAVNGRHAIKFKERLELDVWYVDHWSLWLDLKILAVTAYQVLRRTDVSTTESIEQIGFPLPMGKVQAHATGPGEGTSPTVAAGTVPVPSRTIAP
jgi:lipopolysaccharide/colanic/teichoic acid biosynthesis glycosyltransferase